MSAELDPHALLAAAKQAAEYAYAPYSHFHVGAALLCADGTLLSGCNVENASFGLTICAERTALTKAISNGQRQFKAIAIYAERYDIKNDKRVPDTNLSPCGACRQVMVELLDKNTPVVCASDNAVGYVQYTVAELLPHQFELNR